VVLTATKVKTYVDGLNVANKDEVESTINEKLAPVIDRLNALDVIDSEDGINTLIERFNQVNDMLSTDGNLENILGKISDVNDRIDALVNRVATLETKQAEIKTAQDGIVSEQTAQNEKIAQNTADIEAAKAQGEANKTAIDSVVGTDLPKIRQRVKSLEDTVNDTEDSEGNVTKGLTSKVEDLENGVQGIKDNYVTCAGLKEAISKYCERDIDIDGVIYRG
jgi:chromosome segregation ATPase